MTPADYYYIVTATCFLVLTLLICAILVVLLSTVRAIQRKVKAIRIPERLAVISPWALVMQDIAKEGMGWFKARYGQGPKAGPGSEGASAE
jgi:hypothetical protein